MGNVFGMDWECIDRHEGIVGTKVWARGLGIHIGPEGAKGYSPKVLPIQIQGYWEGIGGMIVEERFKGIERNDSQVDFKEIVK